MRKFQRAAVVAAAVAGLSTLGVGVSFAHDGGFGAITAVASSQANAVANSGNPDGDGHHGREGAPVFAPENGAGVNYGQDHGPDHGPDNGPEHGPDNGEGQ
ncbi:MULTISPECIES: hypothetical protein [unclassified Streptomyces]|uniref:hypothetical protein n=1 Tax=unclassified Streptomyces TaxID=2593676 RepID=UPI002E2F53B0|nr:hypothetical protein [Streptomyces sp. NBC_01431]